MRPLGLSLAGTALMTLLACGRPSTAEAAFSADSLSTLHRDPSLEQNLKFTAGNDQAMTPARFLRWMRHLDSPMDAVKDETATEFRPIVNANEVGGVRVLATFVYKF